MLNKAILMGRLTRDPELRQTDFIDCVAWGRQAEFVAQWFTKGAMAIVVGRIQSRRWQDQNGNNRTAIEVNCDEVSFGETKKSRDAYNAGGQGGFTGGRSVQSVRSAAVAVARFALSA